MIRSICQSKYLVNFCTGHKAHSQKTFQQFLKNQSRLTFATTTNVYSNETEDNKGIEEIKNTLVKDYQQLPKFSHNEACGVVFRLAQMSKTVGKQFYTYRDAKSVKMSRNTLFSPKI